MLSPLSRSVPEQKILGCVLEARDCLMSSWLRCCCFWLSAFICRDDQVLLIGCTARQLEPWPDLFYFVTSSPISSHMRTHTASHPRSSWPPACSTTANMGARLGGMDSPFLRLIMMDQKHPGHAREQSFFPDPQRLTCILSLTLHLSPARFHSISLLKLAGICFCLHPTVAHSLSSLYTLGIWKLKGRRRFCRSKVTTAPSAT